MKRGNFLMTTVATGLMVAGLMTVGRAGLHSQGFLFLAGQLKIAAGDTDSGMKLLAKAASGPDLNATSMLASEKPSPVTTSDKKPCPKMNVMPVVRKDKSDQLKVKAKYAPEPTLASLAHADFPVFTQTNFTIPPAPPAAYVSHEQMEKARAMQFEFKRAQRVREANTRRLMHEISVKYGPGGNAVPDPEQIRIQVEEQLKTLSQ